MKNIMNICAVIIALIGLSFTTASISLADDFAIIVNSANPATADNSEIKNIYLKKKTAWGNGADAEALARKADSPEHKAFIEKILKMSQADLDSHWASEKSKSGTTGPREIGSTRIVTRQVSRKEGAFGIVSAEDAENLPDGVKVLKTF